MKRNPEPVDVVIVGAGAGGATAAKVLTEAGTARGRPRARPVAQARACLGRRAQVPEPQLHLAGPEAQAAHLPRERQRRSGGHELLRHTAGGRRRHDPLGRNGSAHDGERLQAPRACTAMFRVRASSTGRSPTTSSSRTTRAWSGSSAPPDSAGPTRGRPAQPRLPDQAVPAQPDRPHLRHGDGQARPHTSSRCRRAW